MRKYFKPGGLVDMNLTAEEVLEQYKRGSIKIVSKPEYIECIQKLLEHPNPLFIHPGYNISDFMCRPDVDDELISFDESEHGIFVQPYMFDYFLNMLTDSSNHLIIIGIEYRVSVGDGFLMAIAPHDIIFTYERRNTIDNILESL